MLWVSKDKLSIFWTPILVSMDSGPSLATNTGVMGLILLPESNKTLTSRYIFPN